MHTLLDVDVRIQLDHRDGLLPVAEEWKQDMLVRILKEFFPHGGDHQPIDYYRQPASRAISRHRTVVWVSHPTADLYITRVWRERELREYLSNDFPNVVVDLYKRSQ